MSIEVADAIVKAVGPRMRIQGALPLVDSLFFFWTHVTPLTSSTPRKPTNNSANLRWINSC